ncbi:hypothetical protein [Succinimonas amylolytica]|uniref:hypothetical protein n=1 Tax=Succinimonas amylolytica TaxID=83769 RepID=UPI0023A8A21F
MNSQQHNHNRPAPDPQNQNPDYGIWNYSLRVLWSSGATLAGLMSPFHSQTLFLKSLAYLLAGAITGPGLMLITPVLSKTGILPPLRHSRDRQKLGDSLKTALVPALFCGILSAFPLAFCITAILQDTPDIIGYQERQLLLLGIAILAMIPGLVSGYLILELRERLPWLSLRKLLSETACMLGSNIFQLFFFIILLFGLFNILVIAAEYSYGILNDELLLKTYNMPEAVNLIPYPLWNCIFLMWFLGSLTVASRNVSIKLADDAENSIRHKSGETRCNASLMK